MHRALAVPELVFRIVDMFVKVGGTGETDDDGPYAVDKPVLAACARTCRAFHLPATAALWKDQDLDIETVLLHCMPADLWEVRRDTSSVFHKRDILRRPIRREDLSRLLILTFGRAADCQHRGVLKELTPDSYRQLDAILPVGIFCRLRHLASGPYLDVISSLPERCPGIVLFNLMIYSFDDFAVNNNAKEELKSRLTRLIRTWNLRGLMTNIIGYNSLKDLGQSSSLQSLLLIFKDNPVAVPVAFQPGSYRSMRDMILDRVNMQLLIALLRHSTFHSLRSLNIEGPVDASPGDWPVLLRAVRTAVNRPGSVEFLAIDEGEVTSELTEPITDSDLIPLFDLCNLELVFLQFPGGFDLEDATIERMAKSLPQLKGLGLTSRRPLHPERRLSLSVLEPLAMHCPRLELAHLDLDARGKSFRSPPTTYQCCFLKSLDVGWSPITSPRAVAGYLSAWFPQLAAVGYSEESDSSSRWERVQKRLAAAQIARLEDEGESTAAAMARLALRDGENMEESSEEEAE
ncbi:hypothetical protein K523DRAFT_376651 [Schizophyllum commune Tattone D]|nr:hypothetical protein K523DRAFT_376651 [Schizophyllum commune Tattone D]